MIDFEAIYLKILQNVKVWQHFEIKLWWLCFDIIIKMEILIWIIYLAAKGQLFFYFAY